MEHLFYSHTHPLYCISSNWSKCTLLFITFIVTFSVFSDLNAEGSKDFRNYPGYRLFLDTRNPQQMKVYAKPGEFINVGASHIGYMAGFIEVYRPDGTLFKSFSDPNLGVGVINNNIEEINGPTGGGSMNGPGYRPGIVQVPPDGEGIWTVLIDFPTYSPGNFTNLLNNAPWSRNLHQPQIPRVVLAWDITVSQLAAGNEGGNLLEGRVYSNEYISIINQNGFKTSPKYYILTKDGFQYEVDFDEADPFRFPISSNSSGFVYDDLRRTYRSQNRDSINRSGEVGEWEPGLMYYYEPQAEDLPNGVLVNNKIFFNIPNTDMPSSALVTDYYRNNTYVTWLYNEPATLTVEIDDFDITALNGMNMPCLEDTFEEGIGGNLSFSSTLGGTATLSLDLNFDGDYNDNVDRILTQLIDPGTNTVFWDGRDGQGIAIPATTDFKFNYQIEVRGGEAHIIMEDIENNFGGVTFQWFNNMGNPPEVDFYYDHSSVGGHVSGGGTPGNAEPTQTPFVYINNFGNEKYLDYWLFVPFDGLGTGIVTLDILEDCSPLGPDYDMDGVGDVTDIDDDNDGVPDLKEYCNAVGGFACLPGGLDPNQDEDFDGVPNFLDANDVAVSNPCLDANNDGICDQVASVYDTDGDNVPDHLDVDSDNDGVTDLTEAGHGQPDVDGNGIIDGLPIEFGDNGLYNPIATDPHALTATENYMRWDWDNDGVPDHDDLDADNDGINDVKEAGFGDLDADLNGRIDVGTPAIVTQYGLPFSIAPSQTGVPIPLPFDKDMDVIPDWHDLDSDNDTILDVEEGGNPDPDDDGQIGEGNPVVDIDGRATEDALGNPLSTTSDPFDWDMDGIPDFHDLDTDNDGINDVREASHLDPDNNGLPGTAIPSVNSKGIPISDTNGLIFSSTSNPDDTDTDGVRDYRDLDTDNDGINDVREGGNPDGDNDGIIGLNNPVVNNDGQAIVSGNGDPITTTSNPTDKDVDNIPDWRDLDSDNDTILDVEEGGHPDPDDDGQIGLGNPLVDLFGRATEDENGNLLSTTSDPLDWDMDGVPDFHDLDTDNDGINDVRENSQLDPDNNGLPGTAIPNVNSKGIPVSDTNGLIFSSTSNPDDTDTDGVRDYRDLDADNDGINDVIEGGNPDKDNDGIIGLNNPVVNNDGQATESGNGDPLNTTSDPTDTDGDNISDFRELDADDDGISDVIEGGNPDPDNDNIIGSGTPTVNIFGQATEDANGDPVSPTSNPTNTDGDPNPDFQDLDADDDGIPDNDECPDDAPCANGDGDANPDFQDIDRDNDGINDADECENSTPCPDTDDDGILDVDDLDTDGDGLLDEDECPDGAPCPDGDMDGISDWRDFDCNPLAPVPSIDSISGDGIYCNGDLAIININTGNNYNGLVTYQVTGPNGFDTIATPNPAGAFEFGIPNISIDQVGTYMIQLISEEGCIGEANSFDIEIINTADAPDIMIANEDVCLGEDIVLTCSPLIGNGVIYEWFTNSSGSTQSVAITSDPILTIPNSNITDSGSYWLMTTLGSCESPFSDTIDVNILDVANVNVAISAIDPVLCIGETLEIVGNTIMVPGVTYEWYVDYGLGNELVSSSDTSYFRIENAVASNSGTYTLVAKIQGCSSPPSNSIIINVSNTLNETPFMMVIDDNLCEGQTLNLIGSDPTGVATEYEWFFNDGSGPVSLGSTTVPNLSIGNFTSINEGDYYLVIKIGDCISNPSNIRNITVVDISNEEPTISIGNTIYCIGGEFLLSSTIVPGNGIVYDWYFDDGSGPEKVATTGQNIWLFSDLTIDDTGVYTVVANDGGCLSQVSNSIMIQVTDILNQTPTLIASDNEICEGATIEMNVTSIPGGADTYEWYFDDGNSVTLIATTSVPTLFIQNADMADEGIYTVFASMAGCVSQSSNALSLTITNVLNQTPTLSVDEDMLCVGETIELNSTPISGGSVVYQWFFDDGNGWIPLGSTNTPTFFVNDAQLGSTGIYSVVAGIGGCTSVPSNSVDVVITDVYNETPSISVNDDNPCVGELIELNCSIVGGPNVTYIWFFDDGTGNIVIGSTSVATLFVGNALPGNTGVYSVTVQVGGCTSTFSNSVDVEVTDVLDETPVISASQEVLCAGYDLELTSSMVGGSGAVYEWFFDDGSGLTLIATTSSPILVRNNLTISDSGTYSVVVTLGGCQSPISNGVNVEVTTQMGETPVLAVDDTSLCSGASFTLTSNSFSGNNVQYEWYLDTGNGTMLIATTTNPSLIINNATQDNSGAYTVIVTDGDCVSNVSNARNVEVIGAVQVVAINDTSEDNPACSGEVIQLGIPPVQNATYQWFGPNGFMANTPIVNIDPATTDNNGDYFVIVTVGECEFTSNNTTVYVSNLIDAQDDTFNTLFNESLTDIDVVVNDELAGLTDWTISLVSLPENGTIEEVNGSFVYTPNQNYFGQDFFVYEICDVICPDNCSEATVRLNISGNSTTEECFVPNIITPNGDGKNELFKVPCVDNDFLNNRLKIFNRWGDEVYQAAPYKNDWGGTFKGQPLPAGTYFYLLWLTESEVDCLSGYFTITR